jgi:outer membrane receptor protein involved in Fe transport
VAAALCCALTAEAGTREEKRSYNLPSGDALATLNQFAAASGQPVMFVTDKVRGERTNAVRGEYSPFGALERMLNGTALRATRDPVTGVIVVSRRAAPPEEKGELQDPPTMPPKKTSALRAFLLLALAPGLYGQTTPGEAAPPAASDSAVVLSPFTVTSEKDTGYAATTTLAGTRLRSDLRDVGTSISVITREFLQDTGATNTKSLLTYVTGSEVGGPAGNFSGASIGGATSENLGATAPTRLRGLAAASETRNFYATSIPLDSYNIERIEINRGANSILFGTGSPAGIINSSLKQAEMRNVSLVESRYGSYDSFRTSFDFNRQVIRGQLAVRVAGLDKRQRYEQDFAFEDDQRLYGAVTYNPNWARTKNDLLSGTVLRVTAERGDLESRRPKVLPPLDSLSGWFRPWFAESTPAAPYPVKPTWNAGTQRTSSVVNGVNLFVASPAYQTSQQIFRNASVWFDDPHSGIPSAGTTIDGRAVVGRQGVISNLPTTEAGTPLGTGFFASASDLPRAATLTPGLLDAGFYIRPTFSDTSIFDFRGRLPEGPNRLEFGGFEAYTAALEQRFLRDRAGVEFAFDRQRYRSGSSSFVGSGRATEIRVDINTTLLDGSPNPNFGRPFLSNPWSSGYSTNDHRTGRATAFYRLESADLVSARWARWLGRVTFTGLHEEARTRFRNLGGNRFDPSDEFTYGNNRFITDSNGGWHGQLSYIGPSLANASSAANAGIGGLTAVQTPMASAGRLFQFRGQTTTSPFVTTPLTFIDDGLVPTQLVTSANKGGTNSRAQAGVIQGKLLHDTLVVTLGWRRDSVDAFAAPAPARGPRNNLIVDETAWPFPTQPSTSVSDETQSRSYVFHVPARWVRRAPLASSLSLRYTTSENFSPGAPRYDSNGKGLASPSGTTRDVGFTLGLADDRFTLGATWYETKQNNVTASGIGGLTQSIVDNWRLFTNITNLGQNPGSAQVIAPPQELLDLYSFRVTNGSASLIPRPDIVLTQDVVSKGVEFEAVANLTRQWRLMFNAARQSASRSNTGTVFRELFFERKINGQTLFENWNGPAGQAAKVSEGGATLATQAIPAIANPYNLQARQDGGPAQELRKWRFNAVTNYTFARESRLRGFGVGSGVRWQDEVAIGFPNTTVDGIRVPDVTRPFYGPAEWNLDAWLRYERPLFAGKVRLGVQLNVYNVLDDDALIPIATQPTGEVAVWRIPAERRYELAAKFEF